MLSFKLARIGLAPAVAILAGFAVGCSHCSQCHQSAHHKRNGCQSCTASAAPNATTTVTPYGALTQNPPSALPLATLPPVSNERYVAPEGQTTTSSKPSPDGAMLKAVTPAADTSSMPRRSFPDITAHAEFAHAPDYTWLVGELHLIPQKNQWRLRFASIEEEDKYGGAVTLDAGPQMMKECQNGMLVRVEGSLIDVDSREPSPSYRVKGIDPLHK